MKKQLALICAACALNGCIMSGPMALLPPTAKFIMWHADQDTPEKTASAISVEELLKNARGFSGEQDTFAPISISYEKHVVNDKWLEVLSKAKTRSFEMVCGPFEYGSPLEAAMDALKSCRAIKQDLQNHGLDISLRFDPQAQKGQATLTPLVFVEADDA